VTKQRVFAGLLGAASLTLAACNVIVMGPDGPVTSPSSTSTVPIAPLITGQPQSQSVMDGATATFSVIATGTAPLAYQWLQDGVKIAGATGSSYTTPATTAADSGSSFSVVVTNPGSPAAASQSAVLIVTHTLTLLAGKTGGVGYADGTGSAATFDSPVGVATDRSGNVYVSDQLNQEVRKIAPAGVVTTIAGSPGVVGAANGTGSAASFNTPQQLAVDASGNIYVADSGNQVIRMITPAGVVTTYAGTGTAGSADGTAATAQFNLPSGVAVYQPVVPGPVTLFVADSGNNTIRKIDALGNVTTLAGTAGVFGSGDGTGAAAAFSAPNSLAVDPATGNIYVADTYNPAIRKVTSTGVVTTLAGSPGVYGSTDGTGAAASFVQPFGVALDGTATNLYVADGNPGSNLIRQVTTAGGVVTTLAGSVGISGSANGTGTAATFKGPSGVAVAGGTLYVADPGNNLIRQIALASGAVTTLAGNIGGRGYLDATGGAARFNNPHAVATDRLGDVFVADINNNVIRMITPAGVVTTLAGSYGRGGFADGTGAAAQFDQPSGIATDSAGNVYVADYGNEAIRKITVPAGMVTTLAGGSAGSADGTGATAQFSSPTAVATDAAGNVYVADFGNNTIRRVTPAGVVSTFAGTAGVAGSADGTGAAAQFWGPRGVATDSQGNVYVADRNNGTIRMITASAVVTTLAGTAGSIGFRDGVGAAAQFNFPNGPAVDASGNVYVADYNNHAIRKITAAGVVSTIVGAPPGAPLSYSVILGALPGSLDGPTSVAIMPGATLQLVLSELNENSILLATLP
jgi:DNA-binding beta-propeller fold protein YncE